MAEELRVVGAPPAGPARPEDLPPEAQAWAVLGVGEEAGERAHTDALVAAGLGAVVLFGSALRDPAAAARRSAALQAAARAGPLGVPLLLAADQEGGGVCRLPVGETTMPSAMAQAAAGDPALAEEAARATAGQLRAVGVNWDLAPVCDLWTRDNPALGSRCFAADPAVAGAFAAAWVRGLQAGGVLACAKHFPGHGDTAVDSHAGLPVLDADGGALRAREARPFAAAAEAGCASLMLGHLLVPAVDAERPASQSPAFYALARAVAGPAALLVTDSLSMAGAGEVGPAAARAIAAGADLALVAHGPDEHRAAHRGILAALEGGRLPRARLAEAVARVVDAKRRWGLDRRAAPDDAAAPHLLARPSDRDLAARIAKGSLTELRAGPRCDAVAFVRYGPRTPRALVRAAGERWPAAPRREDGAGPWLSLGERRHLLIGPPVPRDLPPGRVLLVYDATPASLAALLAGGDAGGRLPR